MHLRLASWSKVERFLVLSLATLEVLSKAPPFASET
jgi:hypothetical protein